MPSSLPLPGFLKHPFALGLASAGLFTLDAVFYSESVGKALLNFGGMGVCAAVLFVLHREALAVFREEIHLTRNSCSAEHDKLLLRVDRLTELLFARDTPLHLSLPPSEPPPDHDHLPAQG